MRRVLVLRPEPGANATVERLRGMGIQADSSPLFEINAMPWRAPDARLFGGLLLTSANAVRSAGREIGKLATLPVFAVGEATAEAARAHGFLIAAVGAGGVDALLAPLSPDLRLLHLCGEDRKLLEAARQSITQVVVYRAEEIAEPRLEAAEGSVALIHSPRAGRRFAELVQYRSTIAIAAISAAAAEAVGQGWERIEVADRPADEALLAVAARLCDKPPPQ